MELSEEELADFLFNTYDTNRITFEIYTRDGEQHIGGKINFKEGVLSYRFDLTTNGRTKEELEERIERFILNGFLLWR